MSDNGAPASGAGGEADDPRGDLRWASIPAVAADAAERFGDAEALVDGDLRLTFRQLADRALDVTRAAIGAGIEPGDRVGLWAPNIAEWVLTALGLLGAGAVLVPLNTRLKGPEAADALRRSACRALFTVRGFLGVDYPALLCGEQLPDLDRVVLLRDWTLGGSGETAAPGESEVETAADEVPVYRWAEFLAAAEGVVEAPGDVVGKPVTAEQARRRWAAVTGDQPSDIIFTSGTTGRPKGAVTRHDQSLRAFATWAAIVGLRRGDRYLIVNPFFHTFGYKAGMLACLMRGATMVPEAVFDVDRVLERIGREQITVLPGPPTLYQSLLDHPARAAHDLSSLRLAVTGAAVVPLDLVRRLHDDLGCDTVLTAYGLTESTGVVTMCRRGDSPETIAGTSGRAIPGVEVRVAGPDGATLPAGEPGEVLVRGYTVVAGYHGDPEATAAAIDPDGWLHTGDVGVLDEAGNLRITDRIKDMFIVGGFNAYPAEIEQVLGRHPEVSQVAVVGVPDDRLGEVGAAFVVPRPGAEPDGLADRLAAYAREQLANYKAPRSYTLVEALPLSAAGKVLKGELRRWAAPDQIDDVRPAQPAAG